MLGGTALAHVRWEWLLLVNAPIALIAWVGVRLGVPADRPEDLTHDRLDLPGAVLSIAAIGLGCYTLTSGVEHGWLSALTIASAVGAVLALVAFVRHERRTPQPMLDLRLFSDGTVRGAAIAQVGTSIADGRRHVRADPALPVRLRLEPGARRPGQPPPHRHDGAGDTRSRSGSADASATASPA